MEHKSAKDIDLLKIEARLHPRAGPTIQSKTIRNHSCGWLGSPNIIAPRETKSKPDGSAYANLSKGLPTTRNRRCDSGIRTGGSHAQPGVLDILMESCSPTHSATCPLGGMTRLAQPKKRSQPPIARAVNSSFDRGGIRRSSNLPCDISTGEMPSFLTTSDKNAHFFWLDSTNVTLTLG